LADECYLPTVKDYIRGTLRRGKQSKTLPNILENFQKGGQNLGECYVNPAILKINLEGRVKNALQNRKIALYNWCKAMCDDNRR